ncbi:MAG: hypothetical protein M9930_07550 [Anaerolineae bacterium]|nr:hypothetical protein [Anaerolineae bacterium]
MSATSTTPKPRRFIYGDLVIDQDPGSQYSNEDVRRYLAAYSYPEVANCDIVVSEKDDHTEVRFIKKATTKGRTTKGRTTKGRTTRGIGEQPG